MNDNLEELERLLAKATPGVWSTDTLKSEGEYGSGPDTNIGFEVTAIYDDAGRALFDPLNSDAILVEEDYGDENGYVLAYDAVSANNAALIVALRNAAPSLIATAREVEGLRAEVARLRAMVRPQWFYLGDDQSSDQCRFSVSEVIDDDFFGWGERKKVGKHLVHVSTAMPGPDIWVVVQVLSDEEKDERGDDEPWIFEEYDSEETARAALEGKGG